jgi:exosortase A
MGKVMTMGVFDDAWRKTGAVTLAALTALLAIYRETFFSMVDTWNRSETFAHGFLIFPIGAYLVWRKRSDLAKLMPATDYRPLLILAVLGLVWLLANIAGVLVVQQFALIAMIPSLLCAILGWKVVSEIAFPLGFLFFAVPFGEFLIPPLMDFTADFTVAMLKLTGIPVYREGTFFSIPSGDWSVVEGCSGLRYLIASITLGFLYAYLSYRSYWRRAAFMILACIFPVIANGLRAYMIVMIAHLSDMKLALGVDHFIYGWVFFGLVMLLLFWLGSLWIDQSIGKADQESVDSSVPPAITVDMRALAKVAALSLMIALVWPQRAAYIERKAEALGAASWNVGIPEPISPWRLSSEAVTSWKPRYIGADAETQAFYTDGMHDVALYLMYYRSQRQGRELINSQNILIPQKNPVWRMPEEKPITIALGGEDIQVLRGKLRSDRQNLLTWRLNIISGRYIVNEYWGKILEARDQFLGKIDGEAGIVLAVPLVDSASEVEAGKVLQNFLEAMTPSIEKSMSETEAR